MPATDEPLSRGSRIAYRTSAALLRRRLQAGTEMTPAAYRFVRLFDNGARMLRTPGCSRERVGLPGFDIEILRATTEFVPLRDGVVLYLHGGGFVCCGLNTHRPIVARLSRLTGLPAVGVDYRQLPHAPFTQSIDDCLTAYRWLLDHGADPERIVFAGDSAGGYLVFATTQRALAAGLPAPAGLVGISALLDLDCTIKADSALRFGDPFGYPPAFSGIVEAGIAGEENRLALSPVEGPLDQMPPSLLITAESEFLRADSELMAYRLRSMGRDCTLEVWPGQLHAFPASLPFLPESRAATRRIAEFVRDRVGSRTTAPQV